MSRMSHGFWVLAAVVLSPVVALATAAPFTLQKFIVTDSMNAPCPTPSGVTSITVNPGDNVTYCYVVTNSHGAAFDTPITFSTHSLTDTQFGTLTSLIKNEGGSTVGGSFDLQGATGSGCGNSTITTFSHFAYVEKTVSISTDTSNTATWNASGGTMPCAPNGGICNVCCPTDSCAASPSTDSASSSQVDVFVNTNTPTQTATDTPTETPTETPTATETETATETATATETETATETPTGTPTDTATETPTDTQTPADTATATPTNTSTTNPSDTPTGTPMTTPTRTPTETSTPSPTPTAAAIGCRVTGGGQSPTSLAEMVKATLGGEFGAPCGCIGCADQSNLIQGNWQHNRKKKQGNFHATDFNSLMCGCDGVFNGQLCGGSTPANSACSSGVGAFGESGRKGTMAAFRVEVEDHGEPGTNDVYRIRIWIPQGAETVKQLAAGACCTNQAPVGQAARNADIDDGGHLLHGNIQVSPQTGNCPVPAMSCTP